MRAVATPGSSVAKSEAERPLSGSSLTLLELTTPLTADNAARYLLHDQYLIYGDSHDDRKDKLFSGEAPLRSRAPW